MKQILNTEELIGKTVSRVYHEDWSERLALVFNDGSFVVYSIHPGYEGDVGDIILDVEPISHHQQKEYELISEKEYNDILRAEMVKCREEQAERRRLKYLKLKREFEGE